ncbi:MAG TPA: glycosyltransferase [Candidatus Kapabacteria bacterium]|nr:glycosyltransferase [Candidatus Kapabacteria bacterium]
MKNVLIVAYYFPPSGGPGVQRVLKYVQYLREFGWEPTVLTVRDGNFPARDESLLKEIPNGVRVIRTEIFEPYDAYRKLTGKEKGTAIDVNTIRKEGAKISMSERIAEFVRATFFIPDARIGWYRHAYRAGLDAIARYGIDAIYSSSPPYTCALIARGLKRRTGLPWVAGFRDPWTRFITTPDRWAIPAAIDRRLERSVFTEADAVEVAWLGIRKDALGKYPSLDASKFHHLPNGFDSADYPVVDASTRTDNRYTVTYTGSMYGRRNPDAFLKAVELLAQRGDIDPANIRLRFIGRFGDEVMQMFRSSMLGSAIEVVGYMAHRESIAQLLLADALLLVVDECDESDEVVPGKVYEYIGSGRPLMAIAPEKGAIADLVAETRAGFVAHQSNIEGIARGFLGLYRAHVNGEQTQAPNTEAIARYERRNTTGELAHLLERISTRS